MIKAELKNYRQSPRKVRLVADAIRGKKVADALAILTVTTKRASLPIKKLLDSAIANAKHNFSADPAELVVKTISVDEGVTLHRWLPKAHGRATPLRKRSSIIRLMLDKKAVKTKTK